jgi:hypothetical protein
LADHWLEAWSWRRNRQADRPGIRQNPSIHGIRKRLILLPANRAVGVRQKELVLADGQGLRPLLTLNKNFGGTSFPTLALDSFRAEVSTCQIEKELAFAAQFGPT